MAEAVCDENSAAKVEQDGHDHVFSLLLVVAFVTKMALYDDKITSERASLI